MLNSSIPLKLTAMAEDRGPVTLEEPGFRPPD